MQHDAAEYAYAKNVNPGLREIHQMGIEQRADDVLGHGDQPDPSRQSGATEQLPMHGPHCKQRSDANHTKLNSNRKNLVVRIGSSCGGFWVSMAAKCFGDRADAMAEDRRLAQDNKRIFPEFQPG